MARSLHQTAEHGTTVSTAVRYDITGGGPAISLASTPEANRQTIFRSAGTLSNLYVTVIANDRTANSTFRTRKNTANGNQLVTVPPAATGEFTDAVNTDAVASGDIFNYETQSGTGGTQLVISVIRTIFSASANTVTFYARTIGSLTDGSFHPLNGNVTGTTESNSQMETGRIGTMQNGFLRIVTNTRDGDTTFRLRKNSANASVVMTVPAAATGFFEDLVNTEASIVGDLFNWMASLAGTTGIINAGSGKIEWLTTTNAFMMGCNGSQNVAAALTRYFTSTGGIVPAATESEVAADIGIRGVASRLRVVAATNTITAASTFRLRKNAANGNQTVTIAASTTGEFQDLVNSDSLIESDSINYALETGATGGSISTRAIDMLISVAAGRVRDVIGINMIPWARP